MFHFLHFLCRLFISMNFQEYFSEIWQRISPNKKLFGYYQINWKNIEHSHKNIHKVDIFWGRTAKVKLEKLILKYPVLYDITVWVDMAMETFFQTLILPFWQEFSEKTPNILMSGNSRFRKIFVEVITLQCPQTI